MGISGGRGGGRSNFHWCSPQGWFLAELPRRKGPFAHDGTKRFVLIHVRLGTTLENPPSEREKKRVAHNGSEAIPPASAIRPSATPFYTDDSARVCHWEFPKYISPYVLLLGEEWPEFHSFLHLFLRFHKRREGDRISGSLFTTRCILLRPCSGFFLHEFPLALQTARFCRRIEVKRVCKYKNREH